MEISSTVPLSCRENLNETLVVWPRGMSHRCWAHVSDSKNPSSMLLRLHSHRIPLPQRLSSKKREWWWERVMCQGQVWLDQDSPGIGHTWLPSSHWACSHINQIKQESFLCKLICMQRTFKVATPSATSSCFGKFVKLNYYTRHMLHKVLVQYLNDIYNCCQDMTRSHTSPWIHVKFFNHVDSWSTILNSQ